MYFLVFDFEQRRVAYEAHGDFGPFRITMTGDDTADGVTFAGRSVSLRHLVGSSPAMKEAARPR